MNTPERLSESGERFTVRRDKLIRFLFQHRNSEAFKNDAEVREAYLALRRASLNAVIGLIDIIPLAGDAVSGAADLGKLLGKVSKRVKDKLDLTPDVSSKIAIGSEGLEFLGMGAVPTHFIEGGLQLKHDWDKIRRGLLKVQQVYIGHHNHRRK